MSITDMRSGVVTRIVKARAFGQGRSALKGAILAFVGSCLILPAGAQEILREVLPTTPKGDKLEARLATATIEPGAIGSWHSYLNHPVVYVAEGTLTVEFRDGGSKVYKAGEGFIEPINTVLRGVNKGQTPIRLVIFRVSPPEAPDAVDAPSN